MAGQKIYFTKKQQGDIAEFKANLKAGNPPEFAFIGTFKEGFKLLKNALRKI